MTLTLRETAWLHRDHKLSNKNPVVYEVIGLPSGHSATIAPELGPEGMRWRIWHETPSGVLPEWQGDYDTKENALAALQATISN